MTIKVLFVKQHHRQGDHDAVRYTVIGSLGGAIYGFLFWGLGVRREDLHVAFPTLQYGV